MRLFTRGAVGAAFAALLLMTAAAMPAAAQTNYPTKPIRMIVGFAAGGGNDIFARLVGAKLGEILGQQVVVENRPGAAGRLSANTSRISRPTATRFWLAPLAPCRSGRRFIPICSMKTTRP